MTPSHPRGEHELSQHRLGDLLVEMGFISDDQLKIALAKQRATGKRLGWVLVQCGFITEARLVRALSRQLKIEVCDPIAAPVHDRVRTLIPRELAIELFVIPIALKKTAQGETLLVATADPLNQVAKDLIAEKTGYAVEWLLAGETEIDLAFARHYGARPPSFSPGPMRSPTPAAGQARPDPRGMPPDPAVGIHEVAPFDPVMSGVPERPANPGAAHTAVRRAVTSPGFTVPGATPPPGSAPLPAAMRRVASGVNDPSMAILQGRPVTVPPVFDDVSVGAETLEDIAIPGLDLNVAMASAREIPVATPSMFEMIDSIAAPVAPAAPAPGYSEPPPLLGSGDLEIIPEDTPLSRALAMTGAAPDAFEYSPAQQAPAPAGEVAHVEEEVALGDFDGAVSTGPGIEPARAEAPAGAVHVLRDPPFGFDPLAPPVHPADGREPPSWPPATNVGDVETGAAPFSYPREQPVFGGSAADESGIATPIPVPIPEVDLDVDTELDVVEGGSWGDLIEGGGTVAVVSSARPLPTPEPVKDDDEIWVEEDEGGAPEAVRPPPVEPALVRPSGPAPITPVPVDIDIDEPEEPAADHAPPAAAESEPPLVLDEVAEEVAEEEAPPAAASPVAVHGAPPSAPVEAPPAPMAAPLAAPIEPPVAAPSYADTPAVRASEPPLASVEPAIAREDPTAAVEAAPARAVEAEPALAPDGAARTAPHPEPLETEPPRTGTPESTPPAVAPAPEVLASDAGAEAERPFAERDLEAYERATEPPDADAPISRPPSSNRAVLIDRTAPMDERPDTTPSVPARPRPSLDPGAQIDRALIELRRELGLASIVDADSSAFGDSDFDADAVIASVAGHPAPVVGTDPPVPITVEPAVDPIAAAPRASPAATAPAAPAPHAVPSRHETPAPAARTAPAAHAQTAPDPPAAPVPQHAPARSEPSRPARVRAPSTTASQPAYARAPSQPAVPSLRSNPAVAGSAIPPIALAVARARVVLIRFAAGEPLPEATTRWVLRMFAAIMLEHGLLEDARIERALARIGDPPVEG